PHPSTDSTSLHDALPISLLERPKIALTRNQLLDLTKGRDADLFDRSIDNHVSRLRKKIEPDPKNPRYIKTVWGGGYIFAMDPEIDRKSTRLNSSHQII